MCKCFHLCAGNVCYQVYCTQQWQCMLSDVVYQQWQCACYQMYWANIGSVPVIGCPVHISGTVPIVSVHKLPGVLYQHVTGYIVPTCYQMYCTNMLPDVLYKHVTRCTAPTCYQMYCSSMLPDVLYQHVTRCTVPTCYQM